MKRSSGTATPVTGATGFVGRALVQGLVAWGEPVVALSRRPVSVGSSEHGITWRAGDLLDPETLPDALAGVRVAYYLVHSMGGGQDGYRALERRSAEDASAA